MFRTQLTIKCKTYNQDCEIIADAEGVAEVLEKPFWETLSIFYVSGIEITNINKYFLKDLDFF